jgi:hypothetical protein
MQFVTGLLCLTRLALYKTGHQRAIQAFLFMISGRVLQVLNVNKPR